MSTPNKKEEMEKRIKELHHWYITNQIILHPERDEIFGNKLIAFLQSEIDLAVAEERKRIVEMIEKLDSYWRHPMALFPKERTTQGELKEMKVKEDLISLISKNK